MSKERARRRVARLAVEERDRAARAAAVARKQRRRALARRLTPRLPDRRTGRLFARRSRGERAGIAVLTVSALLVVWLVVEPPALRAVLIVLILLALPALVVIGLDRRT
jgi:Flp pilus assembly protein TadB